MYLLTENEREIVNTDFVERFCLADKDDATLVVASYSHARPPVTMARYRNTKEAEDALQELFTALGAGRECFSFPTSLIRGEQTLIRDARTKRRGGS